MGVGARIQLEAQPSSARELGGITIVGGGAREDESFPNHLKLPDNLKLGTLAVRDEFRVSHAEIDYIQNAVLATLLSETTNALRKIIRPKDLADAEQAAQRPVEVGEHVAVLVLHLPLQETRICYTLRSVDIPVAEAFRDAINDEVAKSRIVSGEKRDGVEVGQLAVVYAAARSTTNGVLIGRFQDYCQDLSVYDTDSYLESENTDEFEPIAEPIAKVMDFSRAATTAGVPVSNILRN